MLFTAQQLTYRDTHVFSKIVLDYIDGAETLRPFYAEAPTLEGIANAIAAKQKQNVDRAALVQVLHEQYAGITNSDAVLKNIEALLSEKTFTVCTAHQPNLFTGPLYFIYKILHAIRLAKELAQTFPELQFVPVYYMGSEDADKAELNHTFVNGKRYDWHTVQSGAVGRMTVDASLVNLIGEMAGQIGVQPFGKEFIQLLQNSYTIGKTIQAGTFELVHGLFKNYGLVVLIADHGVLKKAVLPVFEDDLFRQTPSTIVANTCDELEKAFNVKAHPRDINLFYLSEGIRNRIVKQEGIYKVLDTELQFTETEIEAELHQHPDRFSPNVILRGLFQETILPNIAFIGGGGELAYWLQLKALFQQYAIPFPVLVLRNSFLIVEKSWQERLDKWNLPLPKLFAPELQILDLLLAQQGKLPKLDGEITQLITVYGDLKKLAAAADPTLSQHVEALKVKTIRQLQNLEKKIARAERKKQQALHHQVAQVKEALFPNGGLQERTENIGFYYAKWGHAFLDVLLEQSLSLEQKFTVLSET